MLNHFGHSFRKGDTLIEVMFAVGVFGLAAVGAISLMNRGLATA
ncbi:prepilin-type N-terminal cleavage/methylation domain-containing protein, partial [Candidatus Saccharibacteria bacterium]|nr:prepilin-type N-terminal cleavage/methylation domain-containing protein [Candidatus Saccharibacteria bacterium]MBR3319153.1 prepilin-type N-terminal cleavage/methylation domain-containing protein [Candidatus Saccharibacteria bacterium]